MTDVIGDLKNGNQSLLSSQKQRSDEGEAHMQKIKEVVAADLSEIALTGGQAGAANYTNFDLDETGVHMTIPDVIDVNFWASIGVPSNIVSNQISAFAVIGSKIYVGGDFTIIGGVVTSGIASYDTNTGKWEALTTGLQGSATCFCLCVIGTNLYVGGHFSTAGGIANTGGIAKWDSVALTWAALSTGIGSIGVALSLATDGTNLFIGGNFVDIGDANGDYITKWNGSIFSSLGTGLNATCVSLLFIGTDLYVGGQFTLAGGVANTAYIAKWNGSAFSALSTGLDHECDALAAIGTDLYLAGSFTLAGGVSATRIAKWDGSVFTPLLDGRPNQVRALSVIDNTLYIGGDGTAPNGLQQWDGTAFSDVAGANLGTSVTSVVAINGNLYIGGTFTFVNGRPSKNVAVLLTNLQDVLTYLEVATQALQDNGGPFPNNLTVLSEVSASNVNNSGWISISEAWTYLSANTFTVPTDETLLRQKGDKLRWKQGAGYKYGIVIGVTATVITILINTNYTIANSAITDIAMSRQSNPFGWPHWFDITQVGSVTGSTGTVGTYAQTAFASKARISEGGILHVGLVKITNVGSWTGNLQLAIPVAPVGDPGVAVGGGIWANAALSPKGIMYPASASNYLFYKTFPTANIQWADVAVNDFIQWRIEYQF